MCQAVYIKSKELLIQTVKELKKEMPELNLVLNYGYKTENDEGCLCPIDLEKTFDDAKINWTNECMDYYIP